MHALRLTAVLFALVTTLSPTVAPGQTSGKVATALHVATQRTLSKAKVALVGLLLDGNGTPVSNRFVKIVVRSQSDGSVSATLQATTDSQGRALAYFSTPIGPPYTWTVEASFSGDLKYAASVGSNTLYAGQNPHVGTLTVPQGATVQVGRTDGTNGKSTKLRAFVTGNGGPASGTVRFWLNGVNLGSAVLTTAGLATLSVVPSSTAMATLKKSGPTNWTGPVEAWFEPGVGTSLRAAAGIGPAWIWEDVAPCTIATIPTDQKCSSAAQAPSSVATLVKGIVEVKKDGFGSGVVVQKPKLRVSYALPPVPPPNADCDPKAISNGATFCKTSCERLEYLTVSQSNELEALLGDAAANQAKSCTWPLEAEIVLNTQDLRDAHDRCTEAAQQKGLTSWSHDVALDVKHRILASFRFRDPHLVKTATGWQAKLAWQTLMRDGQATASLTVRCR